MGKTTDAAVTLLFCHSEQRMMQASLVLRDSDSNKFFSTFASYGEDSIHHVEEILMGDLWDKFNKFNKFKNIPNNSTIIIAANWGPCTTCTQEVIPRFMERIDADKKSIRVKFRFERYYTEAKWKAAGRNVGKYGGQSFWKSDEAAQSAYDVLCSYYGFYSFLEVSYTSVQHPGITMKSLTFKPTLVIRPFGVEGAKTIVYEE